MTDLDEIRKNIKILWENRTSSKLVRDQIAEKSLRDTFEKLDKNSDRSEIYKFFEKLVTHKIMGVKLGTGATGWCSHLIGCTKADYERNKYKKRDDLKKHMDETMEETKTLIKKLKDFAEKFAKQEQGIENKIRKCYEKYTNDTYSSIRMVIIKLFAFVFPDLFIPVFKEEDFVRFLKIVCVKPDGGENNDNLKKNYKTGERLLQACQKVFPSEIHKEDYTWFLYSYGKLLENDMLFDTLKKFDYYSYPDEEQAVVGLFYTIINSKKIPERMEIFRNFKTYRLQTAYPDLIGKFYRKDDFITVEFEYDLKGYNSHRNSTQVADYVICWENVSKLTPENLKHSNNDGNPINGPPEFICIKDELLK